MIMLLLAVLFTLLSSTVCEEPPFRLVSFRPDGEPAQAMEGGDFTLTCKVLLL